MRFYLISILAAFILVLTGCGKLFDTDPSDDDDLFNLKITHSIKRIINSDTIDLKWDKISIETFNGYRIERRQQGTPDWQIVTLLMDRLQVTYTDTIIDDANLEYRVGIVDIDDNVRWADAETIIPRTKSLRVPDEYTSIQAAFNTALMDDGDSVIVDPGNYIGALSLLGKDVLVMSTGGPEFTTVSPETLEPNLSLRAVTMGSGTLRGFTITGGLPHHGGAGGGLYLGGNGTVYQCIINNNTRHGYGGGVFVTEAGNLYNNIIIYNFSDYGGSGLQIQNAHGAIINNTVAENTVVLNGDLDALIFYNNIIYNSNGIDFAFDGALSTDQMDIDYSCFDLVSGVGSNNISAIPGFTALALHDLTLIASSPCINAGHPGDEYLNPDGTRNTMGAYGGPYSLELYAK